MQFGQRKADAPEVSKNGNYLRNFKGGDTIVRFLQETDDWTEFWEHYTTDGKGFPCTRDKSSCPGCTHESEKVRTAKRKYASNVYVVKDKRVLPFRLPVSVLNKMETRAERNGGTILNRDFVVIKSGSGLDTEYDVDTEDKYEVDTKDLLKQGQDINDIFVASFEEIWGEGSASGATPKVTRTEKSESKASGEEDEVALTVEQVKAMTKAELVELATKAGLEVGEDDTKSEILEKLLSTFGEG